METPIHVLINLVILCQFKKYDKEHNYFVLGGSFVPDIPLYFFLALTRIYIYYADQPLWTQLYFNVHWHNFVDFFHSVPIFSFFVLLTFFLKHTGPFYFFLCMLIHSLTDLPFGVEGEAQRLFLPFSDWVYESPIIDYPFVFDSVQLLVCVGLAIYAVKKNLATDRYQEWIIKLMPVLQGLIFIFNHR